MKTKRHQRSQQPQAIDTAQLDAVLGGCACGCGQANCNCANGSCGGAAQQQQLAWR